MPEVQSNAAIATRAVRYAARGLFPQRGGVEPAATGDTIGRPHRRRPQGPSLADRRAAARLINADPGDVALMSSVAYGVATAAKALPIPAGSRVLVLQDDQSSPVLEWMTRSEAGNFTVETVRLQTVFVLFFSELQTRRVLVIGCTEHPTAA